MNKITPRDFRNAFVAVMKSEHDSFRTAIGFETKSYNYFVRSTIYPRIGRHHENDASKDHETMTTITNIIIMVMATIMMIETTTTTTDSAEV